MSTDENYKSSHIKRVRRSKADMASLRDDLFNLAEEYQPLTIRQLFYRAVAASVIDKTQNDYNNVVVRLMGQMREEGRVPFEWIVDNTRWMRKPSTYSGLESMLYHAQHTYRRSIWDDQEAYVEIWCESDSIAGVLGNVTMEYDVPLMPCGGQPSKSFVYSGAGGIAASQRPSFIYYFGDYDKSGVEISNRIERDMRRYLPKDAEFIFERVAINQSQIEELNLPTRPPKSSKGGFTETVELEAMTTEQLHGICRDCIERHIDFEMLDKLRLVESLERETLGRILNTLEEI